MNSKKLEGQLNAIFHGVRDGIALLDSCARLIRVNERVLEVGGYSEREIIGKTLDQLTMFPPESRSQLKSAFSSALGGQENTPHEVSVQIKNGVELWLEVYMQTLEVEGEPLTVLAVLRDVSARKRAEQAVKQSEERYRRLAESSRDIIFVIDRDDRVEYLNPFAARVLHSSPEELTGRLRSELFPGKANESQKNSLDRVFQTGEPLRVENEITLGGKTIYLDTLLIPLRDDRGVVTSVMGISRDITDRKKTEEALRLSERRYRTLIEQASDGIFLVSRDGKIIDVNTAGCRMLGYTREEILQLHPRQLVDESEVESNPLMLGKLRSGDSLVNQRHLRRKDGTFVFAENCIKVLPDGNIQAIVRDISERARIERERVRSQKLESVALLAGSIAHDFGNFLTAILGNISLANTLLSPSNQVFSILSDAENACLKARALTQQLLSFSSGKAPVKKRVSIRELISGTVRFAVAGSKVTPLFEFDENLFDAEVDPDRLSQAIHNIVINALQTRSHGGKLRVACGNLTLKRLTLFYGLRIPPGDYIQISIEDEGTGIHPRHLPRIFDPYFTTKQDGTGLGLTTAYSIIKQHGGYITLESQPGVGTTFYIFLPATAPREKVKEEPREYIPTGKGRVLVVDDDEALRNLTGKLLRRLGYLPEFATNGEEALQLYRQALHSSSPFDIVMLDMTIPDSLDGYETMQELIKIDPEVKAILATGYTGSICVQDCQRFSFKGVIAKPYSIGDLARALHSALEA